MTGTGGFTEEPELFPDLPPKPAAPPAHADVIRQALRERADEAYPDDHARPYQDALAAVAEGEIIIVPRDALRAVLEGAATLDEWRELAEIAGVTRGLA